MSDASAAFGLMCSAKRFNVALTRAKALAVVLGHPDVLKQDPHWRRFLQHCAAHRAWFGLGCADFGIGRGGVGVDDGTQGVSQFASSLILVRSSIEKSAPMCGSYIS